MAFTGKATYSAGTTLPETAEDVSDIISIVSPYETPLLDHLGDSHRQASSTIHEWLEDTLLPNTDKIDQSGLADDTTTTTFGVDNIDRFRVGDQIRAAGALEVMLVTAVNTAAAEITVERGYGSTFAEPIADNDKLEILGGSALEGDTAPAARFTTRTRQSNYTQIFTAGVEVSGTQLAVNQIGVADEMDFQKQERLRELLRDLENCVINGVAPQSNPEGSATVRRTMNGIRPQLATNVFSPNVDGFPAGDGTSNDELNESMLNVALRSIWEQSSGGVDTLVVNGVQKRKINSFITANRQYTPRSERFKDMVSVYESDFGVCRVVLSRWVPADTILMLDSSRIDVLPLAGRSFHFKHLASTGDRELGQVIGEYTVEVRNENAHGVIEGLGLT
jgi:hypothetical protein